MKVKPWYRHRHQRTWLWTHTCNWWLPYTQLPILTCIPWATEYWVICWKWDRKPTKEQRLPESVLFIPNLTWKSRKLPSDISLNQRLSLHEKLQATQTSPFPLLLPLKVITSETPKFLPLPTALSHTWHPPHPQLSVSIFKRPENTRRGNKGQMPVCDLCLDLAKRDVWIRCMEWKFPWQRNCKAGRRVTYSFYPGKRSNEATSGMLKGNRQVQSSPGTIRTPAYRGPIKGP